MIFNINEVNVNLPKKTNRSKRLKKKMKLDEFAETMVTLKLPINIFDSNEIDEILDELFEIDCSIFATGSNNVTELNFESTGYTNDKIEKTCNSFVSIIAKYNELIWKEKELQIQSGDFNYGVWW